MMNKTKIIIIFVLLIFILSHCRPNDDDLKFRNSTIYGRIDSLVKYKGMFDAKNHYIWTKGEKYKLITNYYGAFIKYVEKGDSLYKKAGRWDIYVYKMKNDKYIEKYFRGAQESWD